ncbi:hypothetical protein EMIHUDRAFT_211783 [Emiliania huxleyi CCMP1516]|uniref:Uncharacterized protein n=2 Tax=Emiliania huxleyi TaxID=2903 RepID=A0A0D3ISY1_EMIH1|nr:hypothetical protein EMIHUDRAFT_211783 [Emiliania huxleyi CCMP1516]EOD14366.1 hypothetical protein EMIHUDRAFT_211783 [Emiliania huxleyi CCMP1516]|eukprot:XP_005766795.1 hypothetical protein EMIHUDRAFT_211783 [Emiliania huxleyi CCMP1516]
MMRASLKCSIARDPMLAAAVPRAGMKRETSSVSVDDSGSGADRGQTWCSLPSMERRRVMGMCATPCQLKCLPGYPAYALPIQGYHLDPSTGACAPWHEGLKAQTQLFTLGMKARETVTESESR